MVRMKQGGKGKIVAASFPQFSRFSATWYYLYGFDQHYVEKKTRKMQVFAN